ncbi:MAG: hypothetical protein ACYC4S_19590, partial [Rhodoferax sp.]
MLYLQGFQSLTHALSAVSGALKKKYPSLDDQEGYWVLIIDDSVVVTFSLVPDGADMDSTSGLDFEK